MDRRLRRALFRWLHSEELGRVEEAEGALRELFRLLPLAIPAPGFADRVLLAAGVGGRAELRPSRALWLLRSGLTASLILVGTALAYLPALLITVAAPPSLRRPIEWLASMLLGVCGWIADGLGLLHRLAPVGDAVAGVLASPPMLAGLAACTLLSVAAFRLLHGLMISERRPSYVDPHS